MSRLGAADRALLVALVTRLGIYGDPEESLAVLLADNGEEEMAFEDLLTLLVQDRVAVTQSEYDAFYDFGERHAAVASWSEDRGLLRAQIVETLP